MQFQTVTVRNGHQYESTANYGVNNYKLAYGGIVRPRGYRTPAEYEAIEFTEE